MKEQQGYMVHNPPTPGEQAWFQFVALEKRLVERFKRHGMQPRTRLEVFKTAHGAGDIEVPALAAMLVCQFGEVARSFYDSTWTEDQVDDWFASEEFKAFEHLVKVPQPINAGVHGSAFEDVKSERNEARLESKHACIALADAFIPESERAGAHLIGLPSLVAHAVEHHRWHHESQDVNYVRQVELERDTVTQERDNLKQDNEALAAYVEQLQAQVLELGGDIEPEGEPSSN